MNMHMPQDDESSAELRNLAAVSRQIVSPANNAAIVGIFQDSLLGSYRFTRQGINFDTRQAMNLLMSFPKLNISLFNNPKSKISNFDILTQILPPLSSKFKNNSFNDDEDTKKSNNIIEIINGIMKRGQLDKTVKKLLHSIFNDFGFEASADFIDNLQNIVTEYMKSSAYSVGISDLIADKETNEKIVSSIVNKKQEVKNILDQVQLGVFENNTGKSNYEEFETQVNALLNDARSEAGKIGIKNLSKDNRFVIMATAGSKGSDLNIAQMISCLGQQNVDGKRIPYGFEDRTLPHYTKYDDNPEARGFVENSFIQGLTPQELFFHAMGGRVGLIDTAVKTASTGYIQRRLVKGLEDIKVEYDMTVRNNKGKIVQFSYGDDGIETTKVENQSIPIVNMTIEEVYSHYQLPDANEMNDDIYSIYYTKEAQSRINSQKKKLNEKVEEYVDFINEKREQIIENVFRNNNENQVHLPIHFSRIINNIRHQLGLNNKTMIDITPFECFEIIENGLKQMQNIHYVPPSELLETLYKYYLSPKELLYKYRFHKAALQVLISNIVTTYKKSIVAPGEMVGMIAAQSIGEPTTQMTLNTFHSAGISSKSNVTRGVPRIQEILSLSKQPKNPSMTIALKDKDKYDKERAQQLMHVIEHTKLRDIVDSVSICFDPDNLNTLIEEDKELMLQYKEFEMLMEECSGTTSEERTQAKSKWIIRFEMNKEEMLEKNITMDDVHFALKNGYKDDMECVFSDYNSDKLVMRIRLKDMLSKKSPLTSSNQNYLDQSDEIYLLKNIQENLLDNIVLKGVKNIEKVILRKMQNQLVKTDINYDIKDVWVLDTIGTNLMEILALDNIDVNHTFSNDIIEVYNTFGIEAARQIIFDEFYDVIKFDGTYINYHHLSILCDRICNNKHLIAISRHGINNDDIGPIAKASFEETPEMFLRAARHAEFDNLKGVSSNVMTGQLGNFGTGAFSVVADLQEMMKLGSMSYEKEKSIEESFKGLEDPEDYCATNNIIQTLNTDIFKGKSTGEDNDYTIDF